MRSPNNLQVKLTDKLLGHLKEEASRRGLKPVDLVRALISRECVPPREVKNGR